MSSYSEFHESLENYYYATYEALPTRKLVQMLKRNEIDDNKYARICLDAVLNTRFSRYCDTAPLEQLVDLYIITHEAHDVLVRQEIPGFSNIELLAAFTRRIEEFTDELLSKFDGIKIPQSLGYFMMKYFSNRMGKNVAELVKKGTENDLN